MTSSSRLGAAPAHATIERLLRRISLFAAAAMLISAVGASAASAESWDHGPWTITETPYTFLTQHTQVQSTLGSIKWRLRNDNPHSYGVRPMKCDGTTAISSYKDRGAHELGVLVTLATSVVANTCFRERVYSMYGTQTLYPTIITT